ncbi:MAG: hypothetical protein PUB89_11460, partial [Oscillospiraceae bacterium]|nr:hypothetical protein [Oscillospiraceae bacterium]
SFEELKYAIGVFSDDFLGNLCYPEDEKGIDLSFVTGIRKMPEWKTYMRTVDGSKKQASINEINFNEIITVYNSFKNLIEKIHNSGQGKKLTWKESKGLTVIYRIDSDVITVYYENSKPNTNKPEFEFECQESSSRKTDIKETLTIDFVLGDTRVYSIRNSCLYTELRLFEGVISTAGKSTYDKLKEYFNEIKSKEEMSS